MTKTGQRSLYRWRETTYNQVPGTLTATKVRLVQENLQVLPTLVDSPETVAGDEPQQPVQTTSEGGGDVQIAFSPRNYDDDIACLFGNEWAYQTGNSGNRVIRASGTAQVTYTAATRTLTTAGTWTVTPTRGDQILIQGSGNAYLDGIHKVEPDGAIGTLSSTLIPLEEDGILSDTAYVPDISVAVNITIVRGERVTNSLTPSQLSCGFERRTERSRGTFLGVTATTGATTTDYNVLTGGIPQRIQLQGTGSVPITGQINYRLSNETITSEADGGATVIDTANDAENTPIFQGAKAVKKCRFYFADMSATAGNAGKIEDTLRLCPQSLSIELANSLQATALMCAQPEFDLTQGEPIGQATVVGIYETPYPMIAFNQQYAGVFEVALVATNGEGYLFRYTRAFLTQVQAPTNGRGQTITTTVNVKAFQQVGAAVAGDSERAIEVYRFRAAA